MKVLIRVVLLICMVSIRLIGWFMVFNATFNNISGI